MNSGSIKHEDYPNTMIDLPGIVYDTDTVCKDDSDGIKTEDESDEMMEHFSVNETCQTWDSTRRLPEDIVKKSKHDPTRNPAFQHHKGKMEIKYIENDKNRYVTAKNRRKTITKKSFEWATCVGGKIMVKFWDKQGNIGTYISDEDLLNEYISNGVKHEKNEKLYNEKGDDKNAKHLSKMTLEDIVVWIKDLPFLNQNINCIEEIIREQNLCGRALMHCNETELKVVLQMKLGNWAMFREELNLLKQTELACDTTI